MTSHLLTNTEVIGRFLPAGIRVAGPIGGPATVHMRLAVTVKFAHPATPNLQCVVAIFSLDSR